MTRGTKLCLSFVAAVLLVVATTTEALAHVVEMKDGAIHEGTIVSNDDQSVVIETTFDGTKTLLRGDVARVDDKTQPLRKQLAFRAKLSKDNPKELWSMHRWAKQKGFQSELTEILEQIVALKPKDKRARKLLGHLLIDGKWMTPEEKEQLDKEARIAAFKAKGLVEYKGEWITPEEMKAREKGMRKDGDTWVTEDQWYQRRGYKKVKGEWIRVGEEAGRAFARAAQLGARIELQYLWSGHVDAIHDVSPELAKRIADAAESAFAVFRRMLKPTAKDLPDDGSERVRLALIEKVGPYSSFAEWFEPQVNANKLVPGWVDGAKRQHSFWWSQNPNLVCVYQFPNTDKTFVSNVVHSYSNVLLTRYKMNYRFPSQWLLQGFAYYLEMESIGYSSTFTLGRGEDSVVGGGEGEILRWSDTAKWRKALAISVGEGSDAPLRRIVKFGQSNFRYPQLAKAWSVVEYMIRRDAAKFKSFVDLSKDREKTEEQALKEAFKLDYRKLDREWRAYVERGYTLKAR